MGRDDEPGGLGAARSPRLTAGAECRAMAATDTLTGRVADAYVSAWMQGQPMNAARLRRDALRARNLPHIYARLRLAACSKLRPPTAGVRRCARPLRARRRTCRMVRGRARTPGRPAGVR